MAFGVEVELCGDEASLDEVAFQFRDVDAVGGESSQRLVERGGDAAHAEDQGRHARGFPSFRRSRLAREDQEARRVVRLARDVFGEASQAVDLSREFGRDGGDGFIPAPGDVRRASGGIDMHDGLDAVAAQEVAALRKGLHVAVDFADIFHFRAGNRQKVVAHGLVMLADDREFGGRKQMMHVRDAARDGVLHRDHADIGAALLHGGESVVEGEAGQGLVVREHGAAGEVGIGSGRALKGDGFWHFSLFLQVRHDHVRYSSF